MNVLLFMMAAALCLGGIGLLALLWSFRSGQFEDPAGDAARILVDRDRPG
jgi:cbb3-type cytochrome oxidase maturation protein